MVDNIELQETAGSSSGSSATKYNGQHSPSLEKGEREDDTSTTGPETSTYANKPRSTQLQSRFRRFLSLIPGPRDPQPLPVLQPLLRISYVTPHGSSAAFYPEPAWTKLVRRIPFINPPRPEPSPGPSLPYEAYTTEEARSSRFIRRKSRVIRYAFLLVFYTAWLTAFGLLVKSNSFDSSVVIATNGQTQSSSVQFLGCTDTFWTANDGCGLDGSACAPFTGSLNFRCPSGCKAQILYGARAVGPLEVNYVPFVIGGGDPNVTYRGDSFICSSAIHAGLFSDHFGGCGVLNLVQNFTNFIAVDRHGIQSLPFDSQFPLGWQFQSCEAKHCTDLGWNILALNVVMTSLLTLFLDPHPLLFFWTLLCIGYWHVFLVSDPRSYPPTIPDGFQDFLPTLFIGYYFWRLAFRFTLPSFQIATLERTLWYLGGFWPGVLLNLVGTGIPINRLEAGSFGGGSALAWVIVLILAIAAIAISQIVVLWKAGWATFYFKWALAAAIIVIIFSQLPGLVFRFHHWFLGVAFVGLVNFQNRVSASMQALLMGITLNGIGKYSFESIVENPETIQQGASLSATIPTFATNSSNFSNATNFVAWNAIPSDLASDWNGFSLLVDDVELYTGTALNFSFASLAVGLPHYFRIAYQQDSTSGDYTRAASWYPNGTWIDAPAGPS